MLIKISTMQISEINQVAVILSLVALLVIAIAIVLFFVFNHRIKKKELAIMNDDLSKDSLTGLLNFQGFLIEARKKINKYPDITYFLIDFDVDSFSRYDALWGNEQGDMLLVTIAKILKQFTLKEYDICARVKSDHFLCLFHRDSAAVLSQNIIYAVDKNQKSVPNQTINLSFGIYEVVDPSMEIKDMLKKAEAAKISIKEDKEKTVAIYNDIIQNKQLADTMLTTSFSAAIKDNEFTPYFQPKVSAKTGEIMGAEALVRWKKKDGSILPPARFIDLFEKNGLIRQLDFYMLDKVCKRLNYEEHNNITPVPISVNFSRTNLFDSSFSSKVEEIVKKNNTNPNLIEIELSEASFLDGITLLSKAIDELHKLGVKVSIDDFGSGYSSLSMLNNMNFDIVKFDKGFLTDSITSERGMTIMRNLTSLVKNLNYEIVIEGVETKEQLDFINTNHCDYVQGYYFYKPMMAEDYDELLKTKIIKDIE